MTALMLGLLVSLLARPVPAQAGWFVRNNQIAYQLSMQGQDQQALDYWDGSAEGWYGRGTALMHLGRMREAEQAFRQSLALAPHKTGFSDNLQMSVARRPGFMASLWYNLGNVLYAQDRLAEARQAWLSALRFEPGHAKARHNLEIVDRILNRREMEEQPPPAGLTAGKRKQSKGGSQPPQGGGTSPQQRQQATQHSLLPLHRPDASAQSGSSGTSKAGKPSAGQGASRLASGGTGEHAASPSPSHHPAPHQEGHATAPGGGDGTQHTQPSDARDISSQQASKELRMVEEGVSVFLRHRLRSGSSQSASRSGGDAW
ncbi:MAG TPA: tetratricopeptide repeat protein [Mariprofundaceae bacterium]|nr:tetratricopeptide repeat protein [Mariprofundaceae bacterium]